jgi:antitoxin FitA
MASITIRDLDERTKERLRVRAAQHKRSMEEEARSILRSAVASEEPVGVDLAEAVRRRFRPFGGVDLPAAARDSIRRPPEPGR